MRQETSLPGGQGSLRAKGVSLWSPLSLTQPKGLGSLVQMFQHGSCLGGSLLVPWWMWKEMQLVFMR